MMHFGSILHNSMGMKCAEDPLNMLFYSKGISQHGSILRPPTHIWATHPRVAPPRPREDHKAQAEPHWTSHWGACDGIDYSSDDIKKLTNHVSPPLLSTRSEKREYWELVVLLLQYSPLVKM